MLTQTVSFYNNPFYRTLRSHLGRKQTFLENHNCLKHECLEQSHMKSSQTPLFFMLKRQDL